MFKTSVWLMEFWQSAKLVSVGMIFAWLGLVNCIDTKNSAIQVNVFLPKITAMPSLLRREDLLSAGDRVCETKQRGLLLPSLILCENTAATLYEDASQARTNSLSAE